MVDVVQAEKLVLDATCEFGNEKVLLQAAAGRVLAEDILSDRDLPPYNRVSMDGIAIAYKAIEQGVHTFKINGSQAAGVAPIEVGQLDECVEIMTGAVLPEWADTIIPYEQIDIRENFAQLNNISAIRQGQNIHFKGSDKQQGDLVIKAGKIIDATIIHAAASVGKVALQVKKLPKVIIISTGDELVEPEASPLPYQIRRSNHLAIETILQEWKIKADNLHLPDAYEVTLNTIKKCFENYDVLILSGGISMGKFDYLPQVFKALSIEEIFYKVKQKPGKPFWFGKAQNGATLFALPGNPVSSFMCLNRYFIPWLEKCLGLVVPKLFACLSEDFEHESMLVLFLHASLSIDETGKLWATLYKGNGSGDFSHLQETDAFIELPPKTTKFIRGTACRIWPYKNILR